MTLDEVDTANGGCQRLRMLDGCVLVRTVQRPGDVVVQAHSQARLGAERPPAHYARRPPLGVLHQRYPARLRAIMTAHFAKQARGLILLACSTPVQL